MSIPKAPFGTHLLVDLHGISAARLGDGAALETLLRAAALAAGATVVGSHFHSFGGDFGVTGVVLLAESHVSIHTWPESAFAAVDLYLCGNADPDRALEVLFDALKPAHRRILRALRGPHVDADQRRGSRNRSPW
jgi:S-adenosylmethionine decarboxylase